MLSVRRRLLPIAFLAALFATSARATGPVPVGPGTVHSRVYQPDGPWAIHVLTVDLADQYLGVGALLGGGATLGRGTVSAMLNHDAGNENRKPIAAVNADFFARAGKNYTTLPLGFHVQDGELVTLPDLSRSVFYLTKDGKAGIERFRPNTWISGPDQLLYPLAAMNRPPETAEVSLFTPRFGQVSRAEPVTSQLTLSDLSGPFLPNREVTAKVVSRAVADSVPIPPNGAVLAANGVAAYALRNLKEGDQITLRLGLQPNLGEIAQAVGGGPRLVREGAVSIEHRLERFSDSFAARRHPRTGLGLNGNQLLLVTVDGRQPGYSAGMTLREFANLFVDLGCREAMNLDGGGSTTMVIRGQVVNSPSDGVERRVANALALFSLAPALPPGAPPRPPVRIILQPDQASVLAAQQMRMTVQGLDEYTEPTPISPTSVQWWTAPGLGAITPEGVFTGGAVSAPTSGLVTARCGNMFASSIVSVSPDPARLSLLPSRLTLPPGGKQQFLVKAYDVDDNPLQIPADRITWGCCPTAATVDPSGLLRAPKTDGRFTVTATVGGVSAQAQVLVGTVTSLVTDFTTPLAVSFRSTPTETPGAASLAADPLNQANQCLRLRYDFSLAPETRAAHAVLNLTLPETRTLTMNVLGDGQGVWLRARLRDSAGRVFPVDLANRVDWSREWRRVTGWLPEEAVFPVILETIYVTEFRPDRKPAGELFLDDIGVAALPEENATAPGNPPTVTP